MGRYSDFEFNKSIENIFVACLLDVRNDARAGRFVRRAAAG